MKETLYFLPWLRRGLGLTLANRDPGTGPLPRQAPIPAWIEIDGEIADAPLALRPADHVTGIEPGQIIRRFPAASGTDAEYGYFPIADVLAPDMPWLLSPAAPDEAIGDADATGRLRPWMVLVCVEQATSVLAAGAAGRPARLSAQVAELPDLDESWAWAHVQSVVAPSAVVKELTAAPGSVIARFVCPRRLAPSTTYRAALVAAFVADGEQLVPAWTSADTKADLLVYDTWTFTTGDAHSFEELCERLGPVDDPTAVFGLRTTDVTELGTIDPWPAGTESVSVDYRGALWDAEVTPQILGPLADDFAIPVAKLLNRSELYPSIEPDDPDPVVAPPFYGSLAAGADSVPLLGWMPVLNLAPAPRMAAGRGAEVVRRNQERYMAEAWRQVGQLRETNRELSITRLQGEIGSAWKRRVDVLDPLQLVSVARSQLTFLRDDEGVAPRRALLNSSFPEALVAPVAMRLTRPGGVVAKAAAKRNPEGTSWNASLGPSFATRRMRNLLDFAAPVLPPGTRPSDNRHHGADVLQPVPNIDTAGAFDLDRTAALATRHIAPLASGRTRLEARIPALATLLAGTHPADAPTRLAIGPVIDEALMWALVEMSAELLLPGIDTFPNNAIRVVETNPAYVASFMAGANHEMSRELMWREFPADLTATTFRRFWDRRDPTLYDIDPIAEWPRLDSLEVLGAAGQESIVLLLRGDLVRHYPNVRILLVDPATDIGALPTFGGWIQPDVRFMGYDVADAQAVTALGSQWRIAIEELPTEPRFGLDNVAPGDTLPRLTSWDDLAWEHLTGHDTATHLQIGQTFPSNSAAPPDAVWGLNAAHMARATYQRPYRLTFLVTDLIGGAP